MRNVLTVTAVLVVLVATLTAFGAGGARAADRVALVIGNNDYKALPSLKNARNDASDIAAELKRLGWVVILRLDAGQREMGHAIETFEGRLATAEAGLVFYAGHGVQARGENWLIPSDAVIESVGDLKYETIAARDILEAMKRSGVPLNIVILDACRNNPLRIATRSLGRGLAVPALPQGIKGTAVMFSAAPGQVAEDGPAGGNGVFTGALLQTLAVPGLTLEELFKRTAQRVAVETANHQRPWFNTSIFGDFYVNPEKAGAPAPQAAAPAAPSAASSAKGGSNEAEIVFWQSIANATQPELFDSYLEQYPNGTFAPLARAKLRLLREQKSGQKSGQTVVAEAPQPAPQRMMGHPPPPRLDAAPDAVASSPPATATRRDTPKPAPEVASLPKQPAPVPSAGPSDAERAKVEALLESSHDALQRRLTTFMLESNNEVEAAYEVQYIWKTTLLDATPQGYVVKIHYDATVDPLRREGFTRTQRFLMRLDGGELKFVKLLGKG